MEPVIITRPVVRSVVVVVVVVVIMVVVVVVMMVMVVVMVGSGKPKAQSVENVANGQLELPCY